MVVVAVDSMVAVVVAVFVVVAVAALVAVVFAVAVSAVGLAADLEEALDSVDLATASDLVSA